MNNEKFWWRGCVIYQIYPRSFFDSNNDGIGDLPGITSKLDYIKSLGVDGIWLSPIFTSPMKDFGYDISDYCNIDPIFGSLRDFDILVQEAHKRDLKVLLDHVVNHTSDQHPWFIESRSSLDNTKHDWYIWQDPNPDGTVPNNWLSVFGGAAWTWDSRRKQYYLHNFLSSQPDLNFHNPDVVDAVLHTFRFWLDRGVDGFRLDTVNYYYHDQELRNNPPITRDTEGSIGVRLDNPYAYQAHHYDKSRPENLIFLQRLRSLFNEYKHITTIGEIGCDWGLDTMAAYTSGGDKLHMAYTFDLLSEKSSADFFRETISQIENNINDGWPCWSIGNHDVQRVNTRWKPDQCAHAEARVKLHGLLLACLRGSICIYQGEELGLEEADLAYHQLVDPYGINFWPEYKGRDGCRTPIPWYEHQLHAGFTQNRPWLPIPESHQKQAVSHQEKQNHSILNTYREIIHWRKKIGALHHGNIELINNNGPVLGFYRKDQQACYMVLLNLSDQEIKFSLKENHQTVTLGNNIVPDTVSKATYTNDKVILPAWGAWVSEVS